MIYRIVMLAGLAGLSACTQPQGSPAKPPATQNVTQTEVASDQPDARIGELSPRRLEDGSCGLFLWSREARPKLVFYADDRGNGANMALDGREVDLVRTRASGQLYLGQYTEQRFEAVNTAISLSFDVSQERPINQGLAVPRGVLSLRQPNGWQAVVPVAGLLACQ